MEYIESFYNALISILPFTNQGQWPFCSFHMVVMTAIGANQKSLTAFFTCLAAYVTSEPKGSPYADDFTGSFAGSFVAA